MCAEDDCRRRGSVRCPGKVQPTPTQDRSVRVKRETNSKWPPSPRATTLSSNSANSCMLWAGGGGAGGRRRGGGRAAVDGSHEGRGGVFVFTLSSVLQPLFARSAPAAPRAPDHRRRLASSSSSRRSSSSSSRAAEQHSSSSCCLLLLLLLERPGTARLLGVYLYVYRVICETCAGNG